jgi:hypothetical protein
MPALNRVAAIDGGPRGGRARGRRQRAGAEVERDDGREPLAGRRHNMKVVKLLLAMAALVAPTAARAADKALLIELPNQVYPSAVSSDLTVVGGLGEGGGFYWMPTTGVVYVGGWQALSTSRDGNTIVGEALDANKLKQAGIWQRAIEWRLLGSIAASALPCDDLLSVAIDSSADGRALVGLAWNTCNIARAFRWEESTGMVNLGSTVADRSSRADAISGDATARPTSTMPRRTSAIPSASARACCTSST